jgi:hypothetical protein
MKLREVNQAYKDILVSKGVRMQMGNFASLFAKYGRVENFGV